jgi:hypothetical protein
MVSGHAVQVKTDLVRTCKPNGAKREETKGVKEKANSVTISLQYDDDLVRVDWRQVQSRTVINWSEVSRL